VLLADDELNDILLFQMAFKNVAPQDQLFVVRDGSEAISYLSGEDGYSDRTRYPLPEYAIFDLKMLRRSGFDAIAWVKSNERFRYLPIVVFSSSDRPQDINRAYALGANGYITKPVRHEELVSIVRAIHDFWRLAAKYS
jgi:CheY-like chemotaxis protein